MSRFTLDDLEFNTDFPDANGVYWYVDRLEGWDSPPVRPAIVEPTTRHGSVLARSTLGPRSITLGGLVKAPSVEEFWKAYNYLLGKIGALYDPIWFTVEEDIDRRCGVVRGGEPRLAHSGVNAFTFQLSMTAYDPLKYNTSETATTLAAGQTKIITNAGNFVSEKVAVTATGAGYPAVANLTYDTVGLRTDEGVPSGTVFDFLERTVTSGDTNLYGALAPSSHWWMLQPGANSVKNIGTVPLTVRHYSAWL